VIEVLVLGPIELRRDGEVVPVPGGKPRAVLAAVVIDPTRAVSQDRLIEAL
jgi:SARP family transcriptional regulator, regulator of embCAB operon